MRLERLGQAGTATGWRAKVASVLAPRVAARTRLSEEQARALVGVVFVALSGYYLLTTLRRMPNRG